MTHAVAIVGLGGIGMLYDIQSPGPATVLSHAKAFALHPGFSIVGAVDPNPALREQFAVEYRLPAYSSVAELLARCSPDVVVVSSPTMTHLDVIRETLQHCTPKAILCEKPLAYGSEQAETIVQLCDERGVQLFVNYIRRADPAVMEVKARLESGRIQGPFKAVVWYSKGLLHNGSHFIDLMTFWCGEPTSAALIAPGRRLGERDSEPDFRVEFDTGSAVFLSAQEENFSHYTVEMVAQNGRLRYEQGGAIGWQTVTPHPTLHNYRQLAPAAETIENDMRRYQYRVTEQLGLALAGAAHTLCTGHMGVTYVRLLERLIDARE